MEPNNTPARQEEPEILQENVSRETIEPPPEGDGFEQPEEMTLTFQVGYDEVFSALNRTDRVDGTLKKQRNRVALLGVLAVLQAIYFFQSGNGFALIMALLLGGMIYLLRQKGNGVNHRIAKAFAQEERQEFTVTSEAMIVNGTRASYGDGMKAFEFQDCYSIIYHGNRTFVIPKRVLSQEDQEQLHSRLKGLLGDSYEEHLG